MSKLSKKKIKLDSNEKERKQIKVTKTKMSKKIKLDLKMEPIDFAKTTTEKKLEQFIKKANDVYYNTGKPLVSDEIYDDIIDIFKTRFPKNTILNQIGAPIRSEIEKATIPYWMGSMDKVKPSSKSLELWLKKYSPPFVVSEKLDGLSGLLTFNLKEKGEIKLYTRGNGTVGQNISHLIPFLNLNTPSILKKIGTTQVITIRGELIMKKAIFTKKYASKYPKARSLISGNINAKKPNPQIIKDIDFVGYEVITNDKKSLPANEQFDLIKKLGIDVVKNKIIKSPLDSDMLVKLLVDMKTASQYEIDGIIITDTKAHERNKSGNPKYAVAFKSQLDEQTAITTVEYVEYNPSKHGSLIPRIKLKPVVIGGDTINYTTGFNAKYIKDNKIGVGTKLKIIRSGDVIPYILGVISIAKDGSWQKPSDDMKWRWSSNEVHIELVDKSSNKNVIIKSLLNFFTTLKIVGVSEGMITRIVENGFNTIANICGMSIADFLTLPAIKDKMATKLHSNIHSIIDKPIPLEKLMTATNIFKGGLGEKKIVVVVRQYPDLMNSVLKEEEVMICEGFSTKTARAFITGLEKFKTFMKEHPFLKYNIKSSNTNTNSGNSKDINEKPKKEGNMGNEFIVMTGFRDKELEDKLVGMGATIQSSINSKTTLVIAKDINSNSGKVKKAKEMGIKVVSKDVI
jgi:DNA ligase (NAD+)